MATALKTAGVTLRTSELVSPPKVGDTDPQRTFRQANRPRRSSSRSRAPASGPRVRGNVRGRAGRFVRQRAAFSLRKNLNAKERGIDVQTEPPVTRGRVHPPVIFLSAGSTENGDVAFSKRLQQCPFNNAVGCEGDGQVRREPVLACSARRFSSSAGVLAWMTNG
jgi:hypothetical protein